jgi:hypothetical protein
MKGQVTFDFMMTMGMATIIFIFMVNAIISQQEEAAGIMSSSNAKGLLEGFTVKLNAVYLGGNNASADYTFPETLSGGEYTVVVYPRSVLLSYDDSQQHYFSARTLVADVDSGGLGDLSGLKVRLTNERGRVRIESE